MYICIISITILVAFNNNNNYVCMYVCVCLLFSVRTRDVAPSPSVITSLSLGEIGLRRRDICLYVFSCRFSFASLMFIWFKVLYFSFK